MFLIPGLYMKATAKSQGALEWINELPEGFTAEAEGPHPSPRICKNLNATIGHHVAPQGKMVRGRSRMRSTDAYLYFLGRRDQPNYTP